ncbi:hypothetical protein [Holospora curviuscula]|uniref:Uncharacterized protein n=1 Tax=Holospora curviuscula TaxID=1082868 RepID=A0A2S5RE36_9PROT|nr:hypothetical protein [Holospora curviuscula]PPE05574.1 hypothetical protein HCUR_00220 [Holospora curviuscula]
MSKHLKAETSKKPNFKLSVENSNVKNSEQYITDNVQKLLNVPKDDFNNTSKKFESELKSLYSTIDQEQKKDFQESMARVYDFMNELLYSITPDEEQINLDGTIQDKGPFTFDGKKEDKEGAIMNQIIELFGESTHRALSSAKSKLIKFWTKYKKTV